MTMDMAFLRVCLKHIENQYPEGKAPKTLLKTRDVDSLEKLVYGLENEVKTQCFDLDCKTCSFKIKDLLRCHIFCNSEEDMIGAFE